MDNIGALGDFRTVLEFFLTLRGTHPHQRAQTDPKYASGYRSHRRSVHGDSRCNRQHYGVCAGIGPLTSSPNVLRNAGGRVLSLSEIGDAASRRFSGETVVAYEPSLYPDLPSMVVLPSGIAYVNQYEWQPPDANRRPRSECSA